MDENFTFAVLFLFFAAILDALDFGRVARLIKGTSFYYFQIFLRKNLLE